MLAEDERKWAFIPLFSRERREVWLQGLFNFYPHQGTNPPCGDQFPHCSLLTQSIHKLNKHLLKKEYVSLLKFFPSFSAILFFFDGLYCFEIISLMYSLQIVKCTFHVRNAWQYWICSWFYWLPVVFYDRFIFHPKMSAWSLLELVWLRTLCRCVEEERSFLWKMFAIINGLFLALIRFSCY